MGKKRHFGKRFLYTFLALLAIVFLVVGIGWFHELRTVMSIRTVVKGDPSQGAGQVYEMRVSGGFYLDDLIHQGGVKSDRELIDFLGKHITKGLMKLDIEESEIACSSFTAKTQSGERLFGRNYDLDPTHSMIVRTSRRGDRHATISSVDLKFLGIKPESTGLSLKDKFKLLSAPYAPLDGMNEKGVSVGIYMTYQGKTTVATDQNTEKPDITSTTMLRLILDYADDLDEAVEIAKGYDLHDSAKTSYHYMVADASGRSAILEWVNGTDQTDNDGAKRQLKVTYNDQDQQLGEREAKSDFQWVTNFVVQANYYENQSDKNGLERYDLLYELLSPSQAVLNSEQEAMEVLQKLGRRKGKVKEGDSVTVHSVVYNLSKKEALWVSNERFGEEAAKLVLNFE